MKKCILTFVAFAAALCACNKLENIIPEPQAPEDVIRATELVFTATMEGVTESKATLDGMTPSWEEGDLISINGTTYSAQEAGTATSFKVAIEGQSAEGPTYNAFFPSGLFDGTTASLPATQTYKAGKFDMPMYAESSTTELQFKNLCAVLAIKVTSADIATLKSIKVLSDKALSGEFTVREQTSGAKDYKASLADATDNTKTVELVSETALTLNAEGTVFYIPIPAQEYKYLNICLSSDGTSYTKAMATKNPAGLGEIARNKMFSIDYETNAVRLYADGPYWATCNIGASSAAGSGKYYAWGNTSGYSPNGSTFSHEFSWNNCEYANHGEYGAPHINKKVFTKYIPSDKATDYCAAGYSPDDKTTLDLEDDAANQSWGGIWRMPTQAEFEALVSNAATKGWTADYNETGVSGYTFTGNGNTLFFPAAGYAQLTSLTPGGDYWTSSLKAENPEYAYSFYFAEAVDASISWLERRRGLPIRAVIEIN